MAGVGSPVLIFADFLFPFDSSAATPAETMEVNAGQLKTGDRVTTSGGFRGTIVALRDDNIHLRVPPDNIRLEVARSSIVSVSRGDEVAKTA